MKDTHAPHVTNHKGVSDDPFVGLTAIAGEMEQDRRASPELTAALNAITSSLAEQVESEGHDWVISHLIYEMSGGLDDSIPWQTTAAKIRDIAQNLLVCSAEDAFDYGDFDPADYSEAFQMSEDDLERTFRIGVDRPLSTLPYPWPAEHLGLTLPR